MSDVERATLVVALVVERAGAEARASALRAEVRRWTDELVGRVLRAAGVKVLAIRAGVVAGDATVVTGAVGHGG